MKPDLCSYGRVLIVEDDEELAADIAMVLERDGLECAHASDGLQGLEKAREYSPDAILTDFRMPGMGGLELLQALQKAFVRPRPVILMTAHGSTKITIESMRQGAFDYLVKPFEMQDLREVIHKALRTSRLNRKVVAMPSEARPEEGVDVMIGECVPMQELFKNIGRISSTKVPVLIEGETGTGKELVARAIFSHSTRQDGPFIAVNCAAIPESLIESELFGHEKGAFTHAHRQRIGRFEQAHKGTLFLDEIGEMPLDMQVKLLRALQEGTICRVGGSGEIAVDVRLITATNRNLSEEVAAGRFREDLYYRIHTANLRLPPLRERGEDIIRLAKYFITRCQREFGRKRNFRLGPKALRPLLSHPWPGNVRELETLARRLVLNAQGETIREDDVRRELKGLAPTITPQSDSDTLAECVRQRLQAAAAKGDDPHVYQRLMDDVERQFIIQALALTQQNQTSAAKLIGMPRATFLRKLEHHGL